MYSVRGRARPFARADPLGLSRTTAGSSKREKEKRKKIIYIHIYIYMLMGRARNRLNGFPGRKLVWS